MKTKLINLKTYLIQIKRKAELKLLEKRKIKKTIYVMQLFSEKLKHQI